MTSDDVIRNLNASVESLWRERDDLKRKLEIAERGINGAIESLGELWTPEIFWLQFKAAVRADLQACRDTINMQTEALGQMEEQ